MKDNIEVTNKTTTTSEVTEASKIAKVTKAQALFKCNVENATFGNLAGWVAAEASDEPIELSIYGNGQLLATVTADLYRADLEKAGIHKGLHGFAVPLQAYNTKADTQIELRTAAGQRIKHSKFVIPALDYDVTLSAPVYQDGHVSTAVLSTASLKGVKVQAMVNGEVIGTVAFETEAKSEKAYFLLPTKFITGKQLEVTFALEQMASPLGFGYITATPILTPWQYLSSSSQEPGMSLLPKQADHRYETLQYQLAAIAKGESNIAPVTLMQLHKVLCEGYEGRKKFPSFELPVFEKPKVSIIVPAYNKFELTYTCIASIAFAYNKTSYEVILADDCSDDFTSEAEFIIKNIVVSRNPENMRFLRSCNRAAKLAQGEYIVFLNNDTEVTSFWLDTLIAEFETKANIGMTGSMLINEDGSMQEAGGIVWEDGLPWNVGRGYSPYAPEFNYVRDVDYLTGAAMCLPSKVWQEVGGFSEELAPCYFEDTDIAFKVRDKGYRTVFTPFSKVIHFEGKSHGKDVTKGLKRYQVINQKTFASKWYKAFRNNGKASLENMMIEKDRNVGARVLVIDYATPQPNKDAGSYAAVQEMKLLLALGFKVTFIPENLAFFGSYTLELQKMGIEVLYAPFYASVFDVINKRLHEMDAVYITRYNVAEKYLDAIKNVKPSIKVVFNNADLHFLRELRTALKVSRSQEALNSALKTRENELAVCRKVDAILCYNSTEHAVITSHILETDKLHLTPWVLEDKGEAPAFKAREGIAFLGGFNHYPNKEAVDYLVAEIMPLLEKVRPDIKLYVYGSAMPEEYKALETPNIEMVGFAENLDDVFYAHRVFVAPLLSGAGIKGKVLEAMAYQTPTVLTETAAEGTGLTHAISTLIADTPEEWVANIIKLYDDQKLWKKFADASAILVKERYSAEYGYKVFKKIMASVGLYAYR
ncbi:glycosyltransferase [Alishewanella tabrizica]|uniref:Glycosyltransferase 2-like domain-containing protein n=1 Tax=Alishewanella tabrizica TaxID=671278 RepID=A0ABQ2WBG3_9ALTE|nr:glycosyltransferase [Alishewanella tabrizica]GGW48449.1 hypothetical protein GCM10008111_00060 [Alishewanella tabrizica]